jgi:hypothetical protein
MSVTKPNIQIDDDVHEMTDEEFAELIASGWVPDIPVPTEK